jgi:cell shape-determining protein MreC
LTFFDPDAAVQTGDTVVTTGHSTRIPRMLRIGRVVAREDDLDFGIRRALVVPFMTASTLKEVQILR